MSQLLDGPMRPWDGVSAEEVRTLPEPDFKGFAVLQDSRIIDMRRWKPDAAGKQDSSSLVYGYRRLRVVRLHDNTKNDVFRIGVLATSPLTTIRFPRPEPPHLHPQLRMRNVEGTVPGDKKCQWQVSYNFANVRPGDLVDLTYEHY
jgi:hypothetical protein